MIFNGDHPDYIPGSDYIFVQQYEDGADLKRDGDIVLVPQPTSSPNDPLNWSKPKKAFQFLIVIFVRAVTVAIADDGFSIIQEIAEDYPQFDLKSFDTATGLLFAGLGGWAVLNAPSAFFYGTRISYIVSCAFGIIGNALFSQVSSSSMLLASQFFCGAATSVGESVSLQSFAAIFFQHQINDAIGFYVLTTSVCNFAGPLIDGYVSQNLGWHWVGYMGLIFECVCTVFVVFGLLETSFDRAHYGLKTAHAELVIEGIDLSPGRTLDADQLETEKKIEKQPDSKLEDAKALSQSDNSISFDTENGTPIVEKRKSQWQLLAPITPANNLQGWGFLQYAKSVLLLCRVFLFPPVIFGGLQWATQIGMITVYKGVENKYWVEAPWNYGSGPLAIMMIPNLIGAAIGSVYSTWATDLYVRWRARRNGGLREAETRLWMLLPALILDPLGMFLFGAGTQYKWAWPVPYVALGFVGFGFGCAGEISISYMADCYPEMVLEGMVGIVFVYTMSALVISFVASYWTELNALNTMISVGVIKFGILALMFPMIFWGKRCRKMTRGLYFRFVDRRNRLNHA